MTGRVAIPRVVYSLLCSFSCIAVCFSLPLPLTPVCHTLFLWILLTSSQATSHQSHHPCCPSTGRQFLLFMMLSRVCHLYDVKPMDLSPFLLAAPPPPLLLPPGFPFSAQTYRTSLLLSIYDTYLLQSVGINASITTILE